MAKSGGIARFLKLFAGIAAGEKVGETSPNRTPVSFQQLEFEDKLRQLVRRNDSLMTANVHVLGLNRIKQHFKARWSLVADSVHAIVSKIIEKHLGDEGTYYCYQTLTYIIVFGGGSKEAGRVRVALMAEEISRRLFGQPNDGSLIETKVAVIHKGANIDYENLDAAKVVAQTVEREMAGHVTEVRAPGDRVAEEEATAGGGLTAPPLGTPGAEASPPLDEPHWEEIHTRSPVHHEDLVADAENTPLSEEFVPAAHEPPPNDWATTSPYATGKVEFVFQPMWLVRQHMVSSHLAVPVRVTATGGLLFGPDAIPTGETSSLNIDLDLDSLRHVLQALAKGGDRTQLISSVHFVTLTEHRIRFLALTRQVPARLKERLIFELVGLPKHIPQTRLYEVVPLLRSTSPTVLLRLSPETVDFTQFEAMGFAAVGIAGHSLGGAEGAVIKAMGRFNEAAHRQGLQTYVHGLKSRSLVSAAVAAGFSLIGGDPVLSAGEHSERSFPFDIKDLYNPLIGPGGRS